jgi:hypothetical protein
MCPHFKSDSFYAEAAYPMDSKVRSRAPELSTRHLIIHSRRMSSKLSRPYD